MTDDTLDWKLTQALRAYSEGGVRRVDPRRVAESAIRGRSRRALRLYGPFGPGFGRTPLAAGLAVVGLVVVGLAAVITGEVDRGPLATPVTTDAASRPPATSGPVPEALPVTRLRAGPYDVATAAGIVRLTVPAGWLAADDGTLLYPGTEPYATPSDGPSITIQDVSEVVADACPSGVDVTWRGIGPRAADLAAALASIPGLTVDGPTGVTVDGHPARRLVLSLSPDFFGRCVGPEGRDIWINETRSRFGLLRDGVATVDIIDVDGVRLVVATNGRGVSAAQAGDVTRILASIEIHSAAVWPQPAGAGRHYLVVDGIGFSYRVPAGWERFGRISLNNSWFGPQGAEAMVYWTSLEQPRIAELCRGLIDARTDASPETLAAAVGAAPGAQLVDPPSPADVAGHHAVRVAVVIRADLGCDPGYFHSWDDVEAGELWPQTDVGDKIRAWVVDVDGRLLFIAGLSKPDAPPALEQEIESIVSSIRLLRSVGPG
jgi:hypothetical protein